MFAIWMRLLDRVPDSVLWLIHDNDDAVANLRQEAARHDIASERLVFATRCTPVQHLARHRHADLFLDTLPINAHTTASDALWSGLPVLTLAGNAFAARVAASLLYAAGLPELVTTDDRSYEDMALRLATVPRLLSDIKARLAANRKTCDLFNSARTTRAIEAAYEAMHARRQAGLAPAHLDISPIACTEADRPQ